MNKHIRQSLMLVLLTAFLLSGCSYQAQTPASPVATLPPAVTDYEAPVGPESLNYSSTTVLYLPAQDAQNQKLLAQYVEAELSYDQDPAETILRSLLSFRANDQVTTLGGPVNLTLYGNHPVETSNGVCTVNLGSSALLLSNEQFYTVCLGIAATLCQLPSIHSVNVLVAGRAVGLDITSTMPLGLVTAHPGEDLSVLWSQIDAQRTPLGTDPSNVGLTAGAALYFPLANGTGFVPETRNLAFSGQNPAQIVSGLLNALSVGALYTPGAATMPDLSALLTQRPVVSDLADGSRLVTLSFSEDFQARLSESAMDTACLVSAITWTITTFVPTVSQVEFRIGNAPLRRLYNAAYGAILPANGRVRRSDFDGHLMDRVRINLVRDGALTTVSRWVPANEAGSLYTLFSLLAAGATAEEAAEGVTAPLPEETDAGSDLLGLAIVGDTLLINLSGHFAGLVKETNGQAEQLLCYALVNTFCSAKSLKRAVFFFDGAMLDQLGGTVYWAGDFLTAPGMNDDGLG